MSSTGESPNLSSTKPINDWPPRSILPLSVTPERTHLSLRDENDFIHAWVRKKELERVTQHLLPGENPHWLGEWIGLSVALRDYELRAGNLSRGTWMFTATGNRFWLFHPRPEEVHIEDVSHGLAKQTRFVGQIRGEVPYSIAQHCLLASYMASRKAALAALLHDAAEAYCHDIITTIKRELGEAYSQIENRIMTAIHQRFGVEVDEEIEREVKVIDCRLLLTECRDLTVWGYPYWDYQEEPYPFTIRPLPASKIRRLFLDRFKQLTQHEVAR